MTLTPNPAPALTLTRRTSGESVWLERAPKLATIALRGSPAFASSIATWHADGVAMEWDGVGTEWGRRGMWRQPECVNNVAASRSYERAASIQSVTGSPCGVAALQRRAGIVTSADTPPAGSMAASSGCEAMLPRARAAWLGLGVRG